MADEMPMKAAELIFLTNPEGRPILNLQLSRRKFMRVEISDDQLAGLVTEGSRQLWARRTWPAVTRR